MDIPDPSIRWQMIGMQLIAPVGNQPHERPSPLTGTWSLASHTLGLCLPQMGIGLCPCRGLPLKPR